MSAYPSASSSMTFPAGKGPIAKQFMHDAGEDEQTLQLARDCTKYTKPNLLPPKGRDKNSPLPESFQSIGPIGATTLEGKILMAVLPPDQPLCELHLTGEIKTNPRVSDEAKQELEYHLFLREVLIQSVLESSNISGNTNRRPAGLRSQMRLILSNLNNIGDTLFRLTDDFRINVFRRDQYVTRRDSCGDPLYHIVCETIDPLGLTDEQFAKTKLEREVLKQKPACERMTPIHTHVEWQPWTEQWVIKQEVNGEEINTSEEKRTCPYISVPLDLTPPDHYGHAYTELLRGSLRGVDNLSMRMQHHAALAAENKWCKDANSLVRDEDLSKPPGSVIAGARVVGGEVQDVALLKANNVSDFSVVGAVLDRMERSLGRAFLMETETAPQGEAGRSPRSWERIALELEGGLGGIYSPINEYIVVPLVRRTNDLIERKKLGVPIPEQAYKITLLTGLSALGRAATLARINNYASTLHALGPTAMSWVNEGVLVHVLSRYNNLFVPGLVKTPEQREAEIQAMIKQQTQLAAGQKAVDVAGNVAESALAPQG